MKKILIILLVFVKTIGFSQETGLNIEHNATWQQILDKAKAENKFIFLDAFTVWCGPCKWMSKEVFPKKEVGDALNPYYISAKIDMEKGEGLELAKKYNVRNYPTYLFFDSNGNLVHRSLGSMPAEDFIEVCKNALNPEKQYITLREKYLSGNRDTAFLRNFIYEALNNQDSLYKTSLIEYLTLNKTIKDEDVEFVFYNTTNLHDTTFAIIQNNLEKFNRIIGKQKIDELTEELVWNEAKRVGKKGEDKAAFRKVIAQFLPGQEDKLSAEYELSLLVRAGKWTSYFPKAEKFATDFAQDDWESLNNIANNFLENATSKTTLQKALKLSLNSVKVIPNFINLLTTAQIYEKLNDNVNARKYANLSLEKVKDFPEGKTEVEEFLKGLK